MSAPLTEVNQNLAKGKTDIQLVVFTLAGCELAVKIHEVREIIRAAEITMMPKAPKYVEGIISLRGRIFPVLDLRKRFEMPMVDKTSESRILVVEKKDQMVGLFVDKVVEVLKVPPIAIERDSRGLLTIEKEFILGFLSMPERLIALFHLEKIFTFEGLKSIQDLDTVKNEEAKNHGH